METVDKTIESLTAPLIKYLIENHHPHTAIIITDDRVMVVEVVYSLPLNP